MSKKRTIATLRKNEKDQSIIVFDGNVDKIVLKDGTTVNIQERRTFILTDSVQRANFLNTNGWLDAEGLSKELAFIEQNKVRYHLVAPIG